MPWETDVLLGWDPKNILANKKQAFSPRGVWNAEYCHDWLMNSLFPEVLRWEYDRAKNCSHFFSLDLIWTRRPKPILQKVDDWARSLALEHARELSATSEDIHVLRKLAYSLQSHFNTNLGDIPISVTLVTAALYVVERLAPYACPLDEYYIRSKLELRSDVNLIRAVQQLRQRENHATLDMALRCVCAVVDDVITVPKQELNFAHSELTKIWQRYREDILCRQL